MVSAVIHVVIFVAAIGYVTVRAVDELVAGVFWPRVLLGYFARGLLIVVLLGLSGLLSVLGLNLLLGGISAVVLAMVLNRRARVQRDALLNLLAMAGERGIALEPVLHAYGAECRGAFGRRVEKLATRLGQGAPLAESLAVWPRLVPDQAVCAARLGTEVGQLGRSLRVAVEVTQSRAAIAHRLMSVAWLVFWPLVMLAVTFTFTSKFLYPRIQQILDDFDMPAPASASWLFGLGNQPWFNVGLGLALLGLMVLLFYAVLAYIGWVPLALPWGSKLFARFESTYVLRHLALVCEARQPLPRGLALLANSYPTSWVRRRLRRAQERIEAGAKWADALAETGLVTAHEVTLLRAAERAGNLPWILRLTAATGERRLTYRILSICQLLVPLLIILVGLAVFVLAASLFVPLVEIIKAQAE
ncbi:MAG: type II secretion system F family protein [Planctomycetaceae bacterium]|nr:type II secretion system F family protein [Planctomycetaceae bacterium]